MNDYASSYHKASSTDSMEYLYDDRENDVDPDLDW
jgi:hypothetical protein